MTTHEKESTKIAVEDTLGVPPAKQHSNGHHSAKAKSIWIAAAVGAGALLLFIGTIAGFAASHLFGRGDFDDRAGSRIMGGRIHGGMLPSRMMGGTIGKVTNVSANSITLTDDRSGGSVTFKIDSNTDINNNKGDNAKVSDIKVGDTVSVRATSATDDTTADTIIINPVAPR